jgi:restriction system protein
MSIWMIRAGEGGRLIDEFAKGYVAIGWTELGDMSSVTDKEQIGELYIKAYPDVKKGSIPTSIAMFHRFRSVLSKGDNVVSYDTKNREYLIGEINGDYEYKLEGVGDYPHLRKVKWLGRVSRDSIRTSSRNALGSSLTLFAVQQEVWDDLVNSMQGGIRTPIEIAHEDDTESLETLRDNFVEKAHEFIKDKILALDADEMEKMVAAILRGMGYRTRVSPKGPDRGVDLIASPDGLGLEEPRIKIEVKHRSKTAMGSSEIRSFLGGLREGDKAIYVSTGGFTKEGKYEADRANVPLTMLDLDDLAQLIVTYYENFDLDGRALIPLVRVYWPAE